MAKNQRALRNEFILEDTHLYGINRPEFTIYVNGHPDSEIDEDDGLGEPGVDFLMATRFVTNLDILSGIDKNRPILVRMSSCGGCWTAGMQMFAAILACPNPVTVLGTKWCRSMTSIIPLAADRFVMMPPTQYMYHRGKRYFHGLDKEADADDVQRRKHGEMMTRIYMSRLREQGKFKEWPEHRIRDMLEKTMDEHLDVWLTADEAVEWGFADGIYIGDHANLPTPRRNAARRERFFEVLRQPIDVKITVS